jgi:Sulfotransferase family
MRTGLATFVHIPKTGGTTLHNVLSRFYPEQKCRHVTKVNEPLRTFAIEKAAEQSSFLIKGHLGINEVADIQGNYIFTFLRPPISRVISHYYFLKEQPTVKHYSYLNTDGTTIESFYALKEKKDVDNCLVRYICGEHETPFGEIGEAHYQRAARRIEKGIDFIGLQEFYDESLIFLADDLDAPLPVYRIKNVTRKKEQVSPATLEFLKEANKWDIKLYNLAREKFTERLHRMTTRQHKRLKLLRVLNKATRLYPF